MRRAWMVQNGVVPAVVVLLTVTCGGNSTAKPSPASSPTSSVATVVGDSPAARAVKQLLDTFAHQDWSTAFDILHPAQRKLIDKDLFVRCSTEGSKSPPTFTDVKVTMEVTERGTVVPGTDVRQDSQLLTVEMNANGSPLKEDVHQYSLDGKWYWATTADAMKALMAGKCFALQ